VQDLRARLLAEAEAAAAANAAISGRWAGVLSQTVPQDMFAAIERQRMACEAVIASKDRLIAGGCMHSKALLHHQFVGQLLSRGLSCGGY
jgi:hypothetical protein